jgi:aryl-alcohol dehydrogenase-like predicted oxidoreductase
MKTRTLSQNLTVSAVGYGAMGLSEFYGQTDDKAHCRCCITSSI